MRDVERAILSKNSRLALYGDAARGLRARQVAHRARRAIPLRLLAAGTHARTQGAWRPLAGGLAVDRAPQSGPQVPPQRSGRFAFVGRSRTFADERGFWRASEQGRLFDFHLHGFAELANYVAGPRTAEDDAFWAAISRSWLEHAGEPCHPGWHPYPLSGRIMAWCAALSAGGWPAELHHRMLESLVRQTRVLRRSVEHDIGGNHVLRNAVALTFAGLCLDLPSLERRALRLLRRELRSQLLADGGHEERSTSYHRAIRADLDDAAVLLARAHGSAPAWLDEARARMGGWERAMRGPDGALALLNDAWEGPPEPVADDRAAVTILRESGYVVMRHAEDQLIIDAGPIAPPHLPPHAHADVLSFVLWADGRPLIVDPGTFTYSGPQRATFRGTAAHNTVEVDQADQCVLWGDFRAAFMPRVVRLDVDEHGDVIVVAARHDGYRRLGDPVEHERWFCWLPHDGLVVADVLHAAHPHRATSRLHLAPGAPATGGVQVGPFSLQPLGPGPAPVVAGGAYAPYLGVQTTIQVIQRTGMSYANVPFGWALLRPGAHAKLDGRCLTVTRRGGGHISLPLR